ncbi:hypothetical protein, partial [Escherichia coli]|uniref:hypothetical protein n=2 Tax=Enterobacteriaceae TaxID=543 RepID=UPI001BC8C7A5
LWTCGHLCHSTADSILDLPLTEYQKQLAAYGEPLTDYQLPLTAYMNMTSDQSWRGLQRSGILFDLYKDLSMDLFIRIYPVDM